MELWRHTVERQRCMFDQSDRGGCSIGGVCSFRATEVGVRSEVHVRSERQRWVFDRRCMFVRSDGGACSTERQRCMFDSATKVHVRPERQRWVFDRRCMFVQSDRGACSTERQRCMFDRGNIGTCSTEQQRCSTARQRCMFDQRACSFRATEVHVRSERQRWMFDQRWLFEQRWTCGHCQLVL